jgi:hypothetical protein
VATGRIGVEIAADKAQLRDAPLKLRGAVRRRHAGRLGQLADSDKVIRIQIDDPVNQIIAYPRPGLARALIADVVRHCRSPRGEDGQVRAPLTLQLELRLLEALADLLVADIELADIGRPRRIFKGCDLRFAKCLQLARSCRVVAVAVDDHALCLLRGGPLQVGLVHPPWQSAPAACESYRMN